jgi:hypothetical protein
MTKQMVKRHKRAVARAKQNVKISVPDVRTPEEIKAAREASRPAGGWSSGSGAQHSGRTSRGNPSTAGNSPAKADA